MHLYATETRVREAHCGLSLRIYDFQPNVSLRGGERLYCSTVDAP